jgi:hypothetical protein
MDVVLIQVAPGIPLWLLTEIAHRHAYALLATLGASTAIPP